jgi:hypothetical protein
MSEPSEDFLASLATQPWRPRSLIAKRRSWLGFRWRLVILVNIVLLHLAAVAWFWKALATEDASSQVVLVVSFVDAVPPQAEVPPMLVPLPPEAARVSKPRRKPKPLPDTQSQTSEAPSPPSPSAARQAQPLPQPSTELQLYNANGRLRVPDDMLDQIDRQSGDQRVFSYQVPHIDDARKYFYRNPALAYQQTRFDEYWTPDQDLLTAVLTKLVEKTTKEVKIPVPGRPGSYMVCTVSILALGGGCGILTNGSDYVGPQDDPDTLNPDEDRQCQAWWNQIVGAKTQDAWRKTRSLYEAQCRKPLERKH